MDTLKHLNLTYTNENQYKSDDCAAASIYSAHTHMQSLVYSFSRKTLSTLGIISVILYSIGTYI